MTQNLETLTQEVSDLYKIKWRLVKRETDEEDVKRLQDLADNSKSPLAEYLYGAIHFFGMVVEEDRITAFKYFDLSRAHAFGPLQMKMAKIYYSLSEEYWDRGYECIVAAANDRHPVAKKILKTAKWNAIKSMFRFQ